MRAKAMSCMGPAVRPVGGRPNIGLDADSLPDVEEETVPTMVGDAGWLACTAASALVFPIGDADRSGPIDAFREVVATSPR